MVDQPLRRIVDPLGLLIAGVNLGPRLGEEGLAAAIDLAKRLALFCVGHHHPTPLLGVGSRGGLLGQPNALKKNFAFHRTLQVEPPPHGAGRREQAVSFRKIEGSGQGELL